MTLLNYLMVGFGCAFLLDLMYYLFRNHKAWETVPQWDWKSRILFALIWPVGISVFIYAFIKEFFK